MKFRAFQICVVLLVATAGVWASPATVSDDDDSQKVERTLSAEPSVTVSICVMTGSIRVRGWDKNEVLARSSGETQVELRQKDGVAQSGKATKVEVVVVDKSDEERVKNNCQAYSDIELFVPRPASVHVQTRDGDISIADIAVAVVGTQNGEISIERVSRAVEVGSVGGSIGIKDSTGRASVTTIGGAIEAVNMRPSAATDGFEAVSVSGDMSLEDVSHSLLNARTVTGNVHLTGPLAAQGRYGFKTMSGDITLTLPGDSSFNLSAKVSRDGEIISDFPLTLIPDSAPASSGPAKASASASASVSTSASTAPATPAAVVSPVPPKRPAPVPETLEMPVVVKVAPNMSKVVVTTPVIVVSPTMRRVNAVCGAGDASIQVASFSGTLHLIKN